MGMDMGMGMLLIVLLGANPLNGILAHPPRDLASLIEPAAVMEKLQVQTSEPDLIALLRTPAPADKDDAQAGPLYVKKLMAIRLIEKNKTRNLLPLRQEVAGDADPTLRDAAKEAAAALEGKPSLRPKGAALLKELSEKLPADTGFVVALDFERDAKSVTGRAFVDGLLKDATDKGLLNMMGGNGPDAQQEMQAEIGKGMDEFEKGLIETLGKVGNVRVDAAVFVFSSSFNPDAKEDCAALIVKGLCDPARVERLMTEDGGMTEREVAGRKVYAARRGSPQFCMLDANTFVLVPSEKPKKAEYMDQVIAALTAAEKKAPPKALAAAFDLLAQGKARVAVGGALSPEQKKLISTGMMDNLKPHEDPAGPEEELSVAGSQFLLDMASAEAFVAWLDGEGKFAAQAAFADEAAAKKFGDSSTKLQGFVFAFASKQAAAAPPQFKTIVEQFTKSGSFWQTEVAAKTVTLKLDNIGPLAVGGAVGAPLLFMRHAMQDRALSGRHAYMPPPDAASQVPAEQLLADGQKAMTDENWADAVAKFKELADKYPNDPRTAEALTAAAAICENRLNDQKTADELRKRAAALKESK